MTTVTNLTLLSSNVAKARFAVTEFEKTSSNLLESSDLALTMLEQQKWTGNCLRNATALDTSSRCSNSASHIISFTEYARTVLGSESKFPLPLALCSECYARLQLNKPVIKGEVIDLLLCYVPLSALKPAIKKYCDLMRAVDFAHLQFYGAYNRALDNLTGSSEATRPVILRE